MNKKSVFLPLLLFLVLVFSILYGVYFSNVNKALTVAEKCDLNALSCKFMIKDKSLTILFTQSPIVEEELFIVFESPERFQIKRAWIEGDNMYMGKTPILFENANKPNLGLTFLGSCNLAEMKWLLFVELIDTELKDAENIVLSASFSTHQ